MRDSFFPPVWFCRFLLWWNRLAFDMPLHCSYRTRSDQLYGITLEITLSSARIALFWKQKPAERAVFSASLSVLRSRFETRDYELLGCTLRVGRWSFERHYGLIAYEFLDLVRRGFRWGKADVIKPPIGEHPWA